ncbi:MAG: hypothetical protein AD742_00415 [Methylibium sp. NZG]|nr:MAG: hypothetical protein AD742_00415 [Methylibium sp. NZG]
MPVGGDGGVGRSAGRLGGVVGYSPTMMTGYHGLTEATRPAAWPDTQAKRSIRTGDLGRWDAEGSRAPGDGKTPMSISGGLNLSPCAMAAGLAGQADVPEAAGLPVPSARRGEGPVAFWVLRDGLTLYAASLLAWVNERVGRPEGLTPAQLVDARPRGPAGRVVEGERRGPARGGGP